MTDIDRTPAPCTHKVANHVHGTRACYVCDRCRCAPCTEANRTEQGARRLQQAYGRYDRFVAAEPVRAHIARLRSQGMGRRRIAAAAGLTQNQVFQLIYGKALPGDTRRPPASRILRVNAEAILAVQFTPRPLAIAAPGAAAGATRRIRALVALGWSLSELGRRLGNDALALSISTGGWDVTNSAAGRVSDLYEQLSMTLPPDTTRFERASTTKARRFAAARDWPPPLGLDDDRLDDVDYLPVIELEEKAS